jgi:hypothetical protein
MGGTPVNDKARGSKRPPLSALHTVTNWLQDRTHQAAILELALIGVLALFVCRAYLDFAPNVLPGGREYSSAIQTHHIWTWFRQCRTCALWNGAERGGYPALVDPHGSALHPLVIATTLLLGVVNGSKAALIIAFWAGGLAQWWMARIMRLGWPARLWSGLMGVVGGHLAARMELGAFGVVLSIAACGLVFPAAMAVARSPSRRRSIVLGLILGLAIVAGQGYIQFGLLCTAPAFLFLVLDDARPRSVWREYAVALGLALLLTAPFLVPLVHFAPNFTKAGDATFGVAQPLEYIPLSLVIRDLEFLTSTALSKSAYPHLNAIYIGWVPVILAVLSLHFVERQHRHTLLFLGACALLSFIGAGALPLRWLQSVIPILAWVRHPPQIAALAVPPILALSAYGLDRLLKASWPRLAVSYQPSSVERTGSISLSWLLVIPLVWNLYTAYGFARNWLFTTELREDVRTVLQALRTPDLQWVEPPFGEHYWIEAAIGTGLKLSPGVMTWQWKDRPLPEPYLEASRLGLPPGGTQVDEVEGLPIYRRDDAVYAFVKTEGESVPCQAFGTGGDLRVECSSPTAGRLIVRENSWTGWYAWRDGERVALLEDRWLSTSAPAGEHTYRFRYLPWDVPLGVLLCLLGIALSLWQWFRHPPLDS